MYISGQHQKLGIIKLIWKTQPANHMYNVCVLCYIVYFYVHYTFLWDIRQIYDQQFIMLASSKTLVFFISINFWMIETGHVIYFCLRKMN